MNFENITILILTCKQDAVPGETLEADHRGAGIFLLETGLADIGGIEAFPFRCCTRKGKISGGPLV